MVKHTKLINQCSQLNTKCDKSKRQNVKTQNYKTYDKKENKLEKYEFKLKMKKFN